MGPEAQHAWEHAYGADEAGRPLPPRFHRLVMLELARTPTAGDAEALERALRGLEDRHARGRERLLMLLAWGPGYFERHTDIATPVSPPVALARGEHAALEDIDACLHLACDDEERLDDAVSELLWDGDRRLSDPLCVREVRTGCVGAGLPARRTGAPVPAGSPLLLGFHSGLRRNQATEAEITIPAGPLAGGTTIARSHGLVGHAQAAARARRDGRPRINRRDFVTFDDGIPGTHFVSLQRDLEDFNATRAVMNAADARRHHLAVGLRANNGINAFMEVVSRATFAVPPRARRAYPGGAGLVRACEPAADIVRAVREGARRLLT